MNTLLSPDHYQQLLEQNPNDVEALYALGRLARDAGDVSEAEVCFERVIGVDAEHVGALGNLANIYRSRQEDAKAEAYFLRVLAVDPDSLAAHNNLAGIYFAKGDVVQGILSLEQVLRLQPDNLHVCMELAEIYAKQAQFDDVTMLYIKANQANPDSVDILFQLAESYLARNMYREARDVLLRCVEMDAEYISAYVRLGYTNNQLQRFDDAIACLQKAISLDETNGVAWGTLGSAYYLSKRMEEAREMFLRAHAFAPDDAYILANLAVAEQMLSLIPEAVEHLKLAIKLDPECGPNYWNLVHAYMFEQDYAAFKATTELALKQPALPPAVHDDMLSNQAIMSWLEGDVERCSEIVEECWLKIHNHEETANRKVFKGYITFLRALIAFRKEHPELYVQDEDAETLYVIGDSHSLSFANIMVERNAAHYRVESRLIVGCKAWHLGDPSDSPYKYAFNRTLETIPDGATVIMTPGEIDCRYNEGIYPFCRKRDLPLQLGIDNTVSGYTRYVVETLKARHITPIFWGVPASSMDLSALPQAEHGDYLRMIRDYNRSLAEHAKELGVEYADVFSLTADDNLRGNRKHHIENVHLKPSTLQEVL